jgi:hypothetical protein
VDSFYLINPNPRDPDDVLSMLCDLYSRRPETRDLVAWELQHILWSLGYTDELLDESEIAAGLKAARVTSDPDKGAA